MSYRRVPSLIRLSSTNTAYSRNKDHAVGLFVDESETFVTLHVPTSEWHGPDLCYTRRIASINYVLCLKCTTNPNRTWHHPSPNTGHVVWFHEKEVNNLKWSNTQGKLSGAVYNLKEEYLVRRMMTKENVKSDGKELCERACSELKKYIPQDALEELTVLRRIYLDFKDQRDVDKDRRVQEQIYSGNVDQHLYDRIKDGNTQNNIERLINMSRRIYTIPTMYTKLYFDRVRPVWLDAFVTRRNDASRIVDDLVVNPDHPSFPSGHSTGTHTVLELMRSCNDRGIIEFDDNTIQTVVDWADDVSRNRERAGLHYVSDTEAGEWLARMLVQELFADCQTCNTLELLDSHFQSWIKRMGF